MNAGATTWAPHSSSARRSGASSGSGHSAFAWAAEFGLLALLLGTAASLIRLFDEWRFLGRMLVPLVAAWACASGLRRAGVRTGPAAICQVAVGVMGLAWWFAPGTVLFGIPTGRTLEAVAGSVQESFARFDQLVAPVPADDGFLIVITATLWVFAAFADAAALRYRAPVQAAVPYLAAFVAVGVLAREPGRTTAAICFLVGLALYAASQRAMAGIDERWVKGREAAGARAIAVAALALAAGAIVVGVAIGPRLPGSTEAVLDLRSIGRGDGPRTVVSPFVGIRSLLGDRSDEVMFTVESDEPAYWRLTSLEEYDPAREIWISRGTYRRISGDLPRSTDASVSSRPLAQQYRIEGLSGVWLPGAYVPSRFDGDIEVSFAERSSSIILRDDRPAGDFEYTLESSIPRFEQLERAPNLVSGAGELDEQYLAVPEFSTEVSDTLAAVVAPADTAYDQMRLLQDWFRATFEYDEAVDYSGSTDAVAAFLADRRGFCQQFSSTFALMARTLGLPARVAVGFTPGEATQGAAVDDATTYVVRGRFAHAWPEIYFEGVGWVPFEPTPQRGNPQAQDYTGVEPEQAAAPEGSQETTTSVPATTDPEPAEEQPLPSTTPDDLLAAADAAERDQQESSTGPGSRWLFGLFALLALIALVTLGARTARQQQRRAAHRADPSLVVADAWSAALQSLSMLDLRPAPDQTPLEFADFVSTVAPGLPLRELAELETARRFGAATLAPHRCEAAARAAASIKTHAHDVTTRRQRVSALASR